MFDYAKIPQELRDLKQWGLYSRKWLPEKNKYTKLPLTVDGRAASSTNETTWSSFDEALTAYLTPNNFEVAGLAFFFKPPYIGIDIDHIKDDIAATIQGDPNTVTNDFIKRTKSYTETSMSGEGIHIITKGDFTGKKHRKGQFEFYDKGRFFALTGQAFGSLNDYSQINRIKSENFDYLYKRYIGEDKPLIPQETKPVPSNNLSKNDVILKAAQSKTGKRFTTLYKGDWQGLYESQSEADQAFMNDLAFWTAKDRSMMDEIMRESGLYRPKWDERRGRLTYGEITMNEAINSTSDTYKSHSDQYQIFVKGFNVPDDAKPITLTTAFNYTDTGFRNRFLRDHPKDVLFSQQTKQFLYFNGNRWVYDTSGVVPRMLDPVIDKIGNEQRLSPDDVGAKDEGAATKAFHDFEKRCLSHNGQQAVLSMIANQRGVDDSEFDRKTNIINTPSGIVDLSSGSIKPATTEDLVTKSTNAEISEIETPIFDKFMLDIFPSHPELIELVQKLIGYTITGTVAEQLTVFLLGKGNENGANGKSVLVEVLRQILGDYAVSIQPETITYSKTTNSSSNTDNQIADTKGARMIATSEIERGAKLSESMLKRLTGGEMITAKRLYEKPISFMPTGTLWMSSNYKPIISGTDNGIWRRLVFIPMTAKITKKDPHLKDKLMTEKAGIMNWIIEGALKYQRDGIQLPKIITNEVDEYREDMDDVATFINDCFDKVPGCRTPFSEISDRFKEWKDIYGTPLTVRGLSRELSDRYERYRTNSERGFIGLKQKKQIEIKNGYNPL